MKGLILEEITKPELLNAIEQTIGDSVLVLMTTAEAAALIGVNAKTVTDYKNRGILTDYSRANQHRKFSARQVLTLKRSKNEHEG
ncbi:MAG: MerR family transcriptional regulator [Desulfobulbaceae bacterium]|nr:MerR family transcriptional regulator [Desulfobulbaceae bacterium]